MNRQPNLGWGGPGQHHGHGHGRQYRPPPPQPRTPSPPDPGAPSESTLAALHAQADKLISAACHSSPAVGQGSGQSLQDLLCRLHAQESVRDCRSSHLNLATNLLTKLATSPNLSLSRLVITLHPGDEGYSISLLGGGQGVEPVEMVRLGYDDTDILDSVDQQTIPSTVMDLISESLDPDTDLYHDGHVLAEIRDSRRGPRPRSHLVLLRPTTQSIICDSISLSKPGPSTSHLKWAPEDKVNIESQLLLASSSPLCLDPSPVVSLIAGKVENSRQKFSSLPLRRHAVKRYSQAGHNRKRKLEALAAPPELALHDFIKNKQSQQTGATSGKRKLSATELIRNHQESVNNRLRVSELTNWSTGCLNLASPETRLSVPAQVDVQKFVRPIARKQDTTDMTPQLDSEYILETAERGQSRIYHTKLTILKRPANDEYIGELYVERDYREGENKGSTCRFELGTLTNATRYINQFTEIFTEEGRKNVQITHKVPNQPPRVSYTPGLRATINQAQLQKQLAQQQQQQQAGTAGGSPQAAAKKPGIVTSQPQLQVTNGGKPGTSGTALPVSGTITVSSAGLGQLVTYQQAGQQPGQKIVPQIVQQQQPRLPGQPIQQTVQVVQQLNNSGQIVQQVVQVPQGQIIQAQQQPGQPGSAVGPLVAGQTASNSGHILQQQSMGQLTALVPTSIASKLPTAPLARPDLPTSSSSSPALPQKPKGREDEEISAIVQSLMREGTQFEFEAKKRAEEQRKGLPSPGGVSLSQPQLPTVPVPAASLQSAVSGARVSIPGLQHQIVSVNSVSPGQMIIVSTAAGSAVSASASPQLSQLAAQLARPTLPTYSQAISQQTSPLRRSSEASPHGQLLTSPSSHQSLTSPCEGGALSALLADTPAADKPLPPGTVTVSSNSLLERLVSGGQVTQTVSSLSPAASQLPTVQSAGHSNGAAAAAGEEITLQSLLSHPAKVQSPNKVSPLLQQLQQPVQTATSPRTYPAGLTSPRHPPASPRAGVTSPRPAQSPRQLNPPQSPSSRAPTPGQPGQMSALQQQLMQPPAPRQQPSVTSHSILSAHLTAPPRSTVSTPQSPIMVSVAVAGDTQVPANGAVAMSGSGTLQLVGGQQSVQLVSNTGQQVQLVSQPQLQVVNHHVNNAAAVQLVNQGGNLQQVQLVSNQVGGAPGQQIMVNNVSGAASGQQIMVNNVPMQLSLTPHVQFSVNLADNSQPNNSIATLANGVNPPIIVSGAPQPGCVTASIPKLVSNGPNGAPATVLLQSQSGHNILLPPGVKQLQPGGGQVVRQVSAAGAQVVRQGQQVMVRAPQPQTGQSPVLVQIPPGQQIVRQVSLNPGTIKSGTLPTLSTAGTGSPSQGAAGGGSPGIAGGQESPMLVQLNHQNDSGGGAHFLLTNSNQKSASLVNQPIGSQMMTGTLNQSTLNNKIRQQRKQSLK